MGSSLKKPTPRMLRAASLLRDRLVERGYDGRPFLDPRTRFLFGGGGYRHHRLRLVERQVGCEAADLLGVEDLAREERIGHLEQHIPVLAQDLVRTLVVARDEAFHLVVDLEG